MPFRSLSFFPLVASTFSWARQTGTNAVVTAASARWIATWFAVLLVVQPPQLKPTIMVRMLPITAPQTPGLIHARFMRHLMVLGKICEWHPTRLVLESLACRPPAWLLHQGPI